VRHRLVQAIITAYESFNGERTLPLPLPPIEAKPANG
jgi:hypothetical protein